MREQAAISPNNCLNLILCAEISKFV